MSDTSTARRKKPLSGYAIKNIGQNRGRPRLWLQDYEVSSADLKPGDKYEILMRGGSVIIQANPNGTRVVSAKPPKREGDPLIPVIDLNSSSILTLFEDMSAVRMVAHKGEIHFLPVASELRKKERLSRLRRKMATNDPLAVGSVSHGGGFMTHAVHEGLANSGLSSKLTFANEIRSDLIEHARLKNDAWDEDTIPLVAPMQELAFDHSAMAHLPRVDLLEVGIPCSGASVAGRAKQGTSMPEEHPLVGHLVVAALAIVARVNPAILLLENVVPYSSSASAAILRNQLRDFGYEVHEAVLDGGDFNALEHRKRWFMVAVTEGMEFSWDMLQRPEKKTLKLSDILEDIPLDSPLWSAMQGLKDKQERDIAAGKGFMMQIFTGDSEKIATITKGYAKVRSTDPKIQHPENPDLLRQLTPIEHSRVKQHPEHLIDGLCATLAHELLGQGVTRGSAVALSEAIGESVLRFAGEHAPRTAQEFYEALHDEITSSIALTELEIRAPLAHVTYEGPVTVNEMGAVIQDIGNGVGILHKAGDALADVRLGEVLRIQYPSVRAIPRVTSLSADGRPVESQEIKAAVAEAQQNLFAAQQSLFDMDAPEVPAANKPRAPRFSA